MFQVWGLIRLIGPRCLVSWSRTVWAGFYGFRRGLRRSLGFGIVPCCANGQHLGRHENIPKMVTQSEFSEQEPR